MSSYQPTPSGSPSPISYFAPIERSTPSQVRQFVTMVGNSSILSTVMEVLGSWVAVLNRNRQVIVMNHAFLDKLKIEDPAAALGLRPGELLNCTHAHDNSRGCGTGKYCSTCGAALAMAAAEQTDQPQERECILTVAESGRTIDYVFAVSCHPFRMESEKFLLLLMRDVSAKNRRIALERTFLHDISNVLLSLGGAVELLTDDPGRGGPDLLTQIHESADTLCREVRVQKLLCQEEPEPYTMQYEEVLADNILRRIDHIAANHRSGLGQTLLIDWPNTRRIFQTDVGLLIRVLLNMVVNGFEAGVAGDQVRVGFEETTDDVTFHVWNRQSIPENVRMRIFQRYFSTKSESGHGLGTYAMKLLGESLLKGKVSFTTSATDGTTFRITHPRQAPVSIDGNCHQ